MALSKEKRRLLERLQSSRSRSREGCFLVEGVRCAQETLHGGLSPEARFALLSPRLQRTELGREVEEGLRSSGIPLLEVTDEELDRVSATEHPQGVLLVVKELSDPMGLLESDPAPRILLLDGMQDPGNAGTLIRAAWAFGLGGVIALEGTVDLFNPKVVRSSAGALAHIPVTQRAWSEVRRWLREKGVPILVGDPGGKDVRTVRVPPSWALVMGNEGSGPRQTVLAEADEVLSVPMAPGVDSLNAGSAGAILLFTLNPHPGNRMED